MRLLVIISFTTLLASCASVSSIPQSASEVDFKERSVGQQGWSRYEDTLQVNFIDEGTAFEAAKSALASANFIIKRGNSSEGFVIGEHGMTAYDWNVVAGVYFTESGDGQLFKVISQGSKDVGVFGDATENSWPQVILQGVRDYLQQENNLKVPDRGILGD